LSSHSPSDYHSLLISLPAASFLSIKDDDSVIIIEEPVTFPLYIRTLPSADSFPAVDGILLESDRTILLQATISGQHSINPAGLITLTKRLPISRSPSPTKPLLRLRRSLGKYRSKPDQKIP